jgi:ankyrin repeat protein
MRAGVCGKSKYSGTVDKLIGAGADVNEGDENRITALHDAAACGCFDITKRLLACNADPNVQNADGETPLHWAAMGGHLGIVRMLLQHGAVPNTQNQEGKTPLDWAIEGRERNRAKGKLNARLKRNYDKIIRLLRR